MTELCCLFASFWSVHISCFESDSWSWCMVSEMAVSSFLRALLSQSKMALKPSGNVSVLPKGSPHVIEITIFCLVETFSLPDGTAQPSNALTVRVKFRPVPSSWGTHAHIHSSLDENVVRNLFLPYTILLEQFQYHPCLCNGSWIFLSLHPHV